VRPRGVRAVVNRDVASVATSMPIELDRGFGGPVVRDDPNDVDGLLPPLAPASPIVLR
jgi:hypothetical protein